MGIMTTLYTLRGSDRVDVSNAVGGNRIYLGRGNDIVFAGTNNTIFGGIGLDQFYVGTGGGNNLLTGGRGGDQFWITNDDTNLPTEANAILDFNRREGDVIGFANTSLSYASLGINWNLRPSGRDTIIEAFGQDIVLLQGIQANRLSESNFVFS
ncbi:MAG: hypothetical protein HC847_22565 [Hydrococcus sp. RU_2_2]|nr:hypothetical protein [Hydrococcus sp. RU_2_2]